MKTFYKVVTCEATGKLTSSAMKPESGLQVSYKFNEFVQPPAEALELGFGICVFDTLSAATEYASTWCNAVIYKCEVIPLENPRPRRLWVCDASLEVFNDLASLADLEPARWTEGTVLVAAVKLLEEVY